MKTPRLFAKSELRLALWQFRHEFAVVGVFSMIANLLLLVPTLYMLQVYDRVMHSGSLLTLLAVSLFTLFLLGVMAIAEWSRTRLLIRIGVRLDQMLNTRVFHASYEAGLSQSSVTPTRALTDLLQVRQFLTGQGIFAFFDAPWTISFIGVLYLMHPFLGYLAIAFAIVQAGIGWFGHRHTRAPTEAATEALVDSQNFLQSKLKNVEVVEAMGMTDNLRNQWSRRNDAYIGEHGRSQAMIQRISAWGKFVRYSQQSLALGAGALLVIDGKVSMGTMIASNVLISRALAPIEQIVSTWRILSTVRAAFERLEVLLETYPERDPALQRVAPKGGMTLRDVIATAKGREAPILKAISLQIPQGSVTAVLGPSGSGKSTLARVLVGIWPNVQGEVLLDGLPINSWDRTELGPHIGYLPQDIELFEGSLAQNIARFSEVDPEKVIAAARCTGLHEMILRFPKGYDTPIGEAGNLLSGGQRQRIALARAVYGSPALIVLDEPNANLDDAGEEALAQAIRALKKEGKTIVLVTHRPGALAVADHIVILRDGEIQAKGPRDAVFATLRASKARATPPSSVPVGSPPLAPT